MDLPEPQLDLMLCRFNSVTPVADVTSNLKVMVMKGRMHREDAIPHLDTVVSPDGPRLACCGIGLAQHHPDSQDYNRHNFLNLLQPAGLDSTLAFPSHCYHWSRVHVRHL